MYFVKLFIALLASSNACSIQFLIQENVFVLHRWLLNEIAIPSFHSTKRACHIFTVINYKLCPHNCRSLSLIYAENNIQFLQQWNILYVKFNAHTHTQKIILLLFVFSKEETVDGLNTLATMNILIVTSYHMGGKKLIRFFSSLECLIYFKFQYIKLQTLKPLRIAN